MVLVSTWIIKALGFYLLVLGVFGRWEMQGPKGIFEIDEQLNIMVLRKEIAQKRPFRPEAAAFKTCFGAGIAL